MSGSEPGVIDEHALTPALLRLLVENIPHHVYAKNLHGRFIFANTASRFAWVRPTRRR